MSTRHLPRAIGSRGKTALEIERENFEKSQHVAITKAISATECPVKEKHARTIVLGTFKDHGAGLYWTIGGKLPLQGNPIIAWKFIHVLHKILRDGHPHAIPDSFKNHAILKELAKLWMHLKEGYGKLIACYCKLMVEKLNFHRKNKEIPGNLNLSDEQFAKICGSDVNNYVSRKELVIFEISVEMLDYMDEILSLQQAVFGSLDMSRSNSMTNSGQCRLAPLILCIQDSCQLYDYIVKSLFRLHSSLPPDTLSGHRDRFLSMYKRLKQFYLSSSNLQYFKNLVQVPGLPDEPPNFLIASDFSKHVKPVAVVPDEPEPEAEPEIEVEDLIDTSVSQPPVQVNNFGNGFPEVDERDHIIERLTKEIQYLRSEIERLKLEDQKILSAQKEEIARLEKILSELRLSADRSLKDNDELKKRLKQTETVHVGAATKLADAEKHAKGFEDKFKKMKDIYQKLREEHVSLLRTNAEVTKKLDAEKRTVAEKEQLLQESKSEMDRIEQERKVIQESLKQSADQTSSQLAMTMAKNTDLQTDKEHLENQLKMLEDTKSSLMNQLQASEEECSNLQTQLNELEDEKRTQESSLTGEITTLQQQFTALKIEKESSDTELDHQLQELKTKLEQEMSDKKSLEQQLKQQISDLESRLSQSQSDKQNTEQKLSGDIDLIHKQLLDASIKEGKVIIQDALDQFQNPTHIAVKCTAEFLLMRTEPVLSSLEMIKGMQGKYNGDRTELANLVKTITGFSHHFGDCVIHGIATTHSANLEAGEELGNACREAGESGLKVLDTLGQGASIESDVNHAVQCVKKMITLAEDLVPKSVEIKEKEIGDLVDTEMQSTTSAIEMAARRIAEMLEKTREATSGVELKVNESILDSCTSLMHAIRILIERSRDLQKEIVAQGRGTSTEKEFYKKNHRWTEGLLSAAKAVGWGATALMEAADKVVRGEGKFEELIVCSNEIAASTAQLVVASKVKADRRSKKLTSLSEASKGVTENTGKVVGSAREGSQIIEERGLMDFSKLSLMQTKKNEMQSQVRVLELEKELETERYKLGEIRKKHYQLAGASEGWDEEEDQECDTESPRQPTKK
ncbi:huntingtin-interacting protein 1-like isoform X4 [Mytilus galloprovincialis]|uniref:huntingtin-interacting protein 1-like isoform X4 n=1 Tax=Mytilus galloprovincialis TaxID=29158 RepID=UPI003F7BF2A0